ncbi:MAG: hypothetical protein PW789_16055 [Edaphobacter sp.]|uniref:hypothetical protein n=1 Tax=Edaphobacter sp. TaxID=1934404 RepID=UPI0023951251|nr:hypothetical protein [Edaphobacter sp.]MDE1178091.1 hypothetical protein [Edaphobacter sp.]
MKQLLVRTLMGILAIAGILWAADWLVWQGRSLAGKGDGTVTVGHFVVAPLKGGKEEYYPDGQLQVRCTRSLLPEGFPQAGAKPCWWLERNPVVFER